MVKLICELRHIFSINLRLWQILILRLSAHFLKNLRSTARKFGYSAIFGNIYAPSPHHPYDICKGYSDSCQIYKMKAVDYFHKRLLSRYLQSSQYTSNKAKKAPSEMFNKVLISPLAWLFSSYLLI